VVATIAIQCSRDTIEAMAKVFVTGADGFIGSHLVEQLLANGHSVVAMAQYNSFGDVGWLSDVEPSSQLEIQLGDIRDMTQLRDFVEGAETVIHLAALIAIPYSYVAPHSYFETNVMGTLNLVKVSQEVGVKNFIHTSTSEVYGTANYVPIDELHPIKAQSPYSASKIGADAVVRSFVDSFDFPAITIRPFNTFGPRQSQRAVIPALAAQFLTRKPVIKVGTLTTLRDFTFVSDTVNGFVSALDRSDLKGEVINLGTGHEVSISQIVELLSELTNHKPMVETDPKRVRPDKSEVGRLMSDNRKARELLGWSPKMSGTEGLKQGLIETLNWLETQLESGRASGGEYVK